MYDWLLHLNNNINVYNFNKEIDQNMEKGTGCVHLKAFILTERQKSLSAKNYLCEQQTD